MPSMFVGSCDGVLRMGCLCSCLSPEQSNGPKPTTPLLSDRTSSRAPSATASGGHASSDSSPNIAPSARKRKKFQDQDFLKSVDELTQIDLKPISLPVLDKSLQDHATLHNAVLENHQALRAAVHDFKELFLSDTAGIPVMSDCIQLMKDKCGNAQLSVGRKSKHCIQIEYDSHEVSTEAQSAPEDLISALELYNRANKLIKDILDRAPNVSKSVQLILDDENGLRKEVTKADLGPTDGPQAMKNCVENISKLRSVPSAMESIQRDTKTIFDEILKGSKNLFENTEPKLLKT